VFARRSARCRASSVEGLLIGVIESVSAYWIGAVYKDIVGYSLFICFSGSGGKLMGKS